MRILAISGSPSLQSSGARLADHALARLPDGVLGSHLRLALLDPAALMHADCAHPDIARAMTAVAEADGLILVTPVYKAAYSGLLKCFLDLQDQFALAGKSVLPLATAGSLAHALAVDYALRPVLQSMGARHVVQSLVVLPQDTAMGPYDGLTLTGRAEGMFAAALDHFLATTTADPAARLRGHPQPDQIAAVA